MNSIVHWQLPQWHFFCRLLYCYWIIGVCVPYYLIQALVGEGSTCRNASKKMSLAMGARCHLEWGHEKYILETINSHPALVSISFYSILYLTTGACLAHESVSLWKSSTLQKQLCNVCSNDFCAYLYMLLCQLFFLLLFFPTFLLIFLYK